MSRRMQIVTMGSILVFAGLGLGHAQWLPSTAVAPAAIHYDGPVGIGLGTVSPVSKFEVAASNTTSSGKFGSVEVQSFAVGNSWISDNIYYSGGFFYRSTGPGILSYFEAGGFEIRTSPPGTAGASATPTQRFVVTQDGAVGLGGSQIASTTSGASVVVTAAGNVGIGAQAQVPTHKLQVDGDIYSTGVITSQTAIYANYQDVAEWVPTAAELEAGTVVVLDPRKSNEVMASMASYDTTVAGVVSSNPGVLLGKSGADKAMIATTGRVKVKVDASTHAVAIGDLLVTSDKPGFAMRSEPLDLGGRKIHQPGTIIGKALEPLPAGQGEILVLLSLQ